MITMGIIKKQTFLILTDRNYFIIVGKGVYIYVCVCVLVLSPSETDGYGMADLAVLFSCSDKQFKCILKDEGGGSEVNSLAEWTMPLCESQNTSTRSMPIVSEREGQKPEYTFSAQVDSIRYANDTVQCILKIYFYTRVHKLTRFLS